MEQVCQDKMFNVPNALTVIRIVLLPVIAWYYKMGNMLGALAVYLLAMLTDALDGTIARKTGQITALGKLLDPLADKLSLLTLMGLFFSDGKIPAWVLLIIVCKEAIMVAGSAAALKKGVVVHALPIGKVTTVMFIVSIAARLIGLTAFADAAMYVSVVLSLAALIWYTIVLSMKLREHTDPSRATR